MKNGYVIGIDQGTTNTKAVLIDQDARIVSVSDSFTVRPIRPGTDCVEFDPDEILSGVYSAIRSVISRAGVSSNQIISVGLANQGETVIAFDCGTGRPLYNAISWQDCRGIETAHELLPYADFLVERTGLINDPYFSAYKMRWILENVEEARNALDRGTLVLATSDVWLLNRLLREHPIVTDVSTASRTLLFNISTLSWDEELCRLFRIPMNCLPDVVANDQAVGFFEDEVCGTAVELAGLCVDQQAALFGEECVVSGTAKITYGTGCFVLVNAGSDSRIRAPGLLTSVGWSVGRTGVNGNSQSDGGAVYVLDGGIFNAGSIFRWMIDDLGLAEGEAEIDDAIASRANELNVNGLYFLPGLNGLAAPHWNREASGSWIGLRYHHRKNDLIAAAAESITFRVREVFETIESAGVTITKIRADGGLSRSRPLMQLQADVLGGVIEIFDGGEATARGVGLFSGLARKRSVISDGVENYAMGRRTSKSSIMSPDQAKRKKIDARYMEWKKLVQR